MLLHLAVATGFTVRRALSVVKKRSGRHEHTIREFRPRRGERRSAAERFHRDTGGVPVYTGDKTPLLPENGSGAS